MDNEEKINQLARIEQDTICLGQENMTKIQDLKANIKELDFEMGSLEDSSHNKMALMRQASSDSNYALIQNWKKSFEESLVQYERLRGAYEDLNREKIRLKNLKLSARLDFEEI